MSESTAPATTAPLKETLYLPELFVRTDGTFDFHFDGSAFQYVYDPAGDDESSDLDDPATAAQVTATDGIINAWLGADWDASDPAKQAAALRRMAAALDGATARALTVHHLVIHPVDEDAYLELIGIAGHPVDCRVCGESIWEEDGHWVDGHGQINDATHLHQPEDLYQGRSVVANIEVWDDGAEVAFPVRTLGEFGDLAELHDDEGLVDQFITAAHNLIRGPRGPFDQTDQVVDNYEVVRAPADESYDAQGQALPHGRCDTCGAPCDADGCTADRTHQAALS